MNYQLLISLVLIIYILIEKIMLKPGDMTDYHMKTTQKYQNRTQHKIDGYLGEDKMKARIKPLFPQTQRFDPSLDLTIKSYSRSVSINFPDVQFIYDMIKDETLKNMCVSGDSLGDWRPILNNVNTVLGKIRSDRLQHVYQFGVSYGFSMLELWQIIRPKIIFGFDSFKGLPDIKTSVGDWFPGAYASDPRQDITELLGTLHVGWIEGWYNESLVDSLVGKLNMKPAIYVDIDTDHYESALLSLDFMFRNNLIVPGTLIGYDDWWVEACRSNEYKLIDPIAIGEGKAHKEIAEKYIVEFYCVGGGCGVVTEGNNCDIHSGWGAIFLVKSIGEKIDDGNKMSHEDVMRFKIKDGRCGVKI